MRKTKKAVKSAYVGSDPAKFIWSNRTHRSTSEAFRDADYATPIWRCENDWDRAKEYIGWGLMWAVLLYSMYLLATAFEVAVS
jgi:hypothetical protein